ncbi:MAG: HAD family phosphatase [Caldilineaceae bacterium]|nr:HAD family phosphatase [Caldilineaceae bacterium]
MIKAIIFDMGGVLVRTIDPTPRATWETKLGLAPGDAERIVLNSEMGKRAQTGGITTAELWAWVQGEFGLDDTTLAAFRHAFWAGDVLDDDLVGLIRYLRLNYQTALLSNFMDELQEVITVRHPMADAFDLVVGSAYEKVMKPDAQIYLHTLARLGRQPAEAVFIDDALHNVEGARQVGLAAIHYQAGMDVAAALAALGVQV